MSYVTVGNAAQIAATGTWQGPAPGSVTAPAFCFPLPRTGDVTNQAGTLPLAANQAVWYRSLGTGLCSNLAVWCTVASGSIQMGVYDAAPVASNVLYPRNLVASTAVVTAAATFMVVPLAAPFLITPSHFIAIGTSGAPSFACTSSAGLLATGVDPTWGSGSSYFSGASFTLPPVAPAGMVATRGSAIIIHGVT